MDKNSPNVLKLTFLGKAGVREVIESIQRLETSAGVPFAINMSQTEDSAMTQIFNDVGDNQKLVAKLEEVFPENNFTLFHNYDEQVDSLHVHVVIGGFKNS